MLCNFIKANQHMLLHQRSTNTGSVRLTTGNSVDKEMIVSIKPNVRVMSECMEHIGAFEECLCSMVPGFLFTFDAPLD